MLIHKDTEEKEAGRSESNSPLMTIEEARAKLARAKGVPDLADMVKAFEGYDGPETCGDPAQSF